MMAKKESVEKTVRQIRQQTRKKYTAEEKIRIVLEGLRGESTIAERAIWAVSSVEPSSTTITWLVNR
jgi:hypothetical protein